MSEQKGQLVVVGTGLRTVGQMTVEALAWIKRADVVLYVVGDPVGEEMINTLGKEVISLQTLYSESKARIDTYDGMAEEIMRHVRDGKTTCAVFYGHPGVFVYPSHVAVAQALSEGYDAVMLPGISAEDCLFADLGVDPATTGCSSYEATDFLFHRRPCDPASSMVLWQIGILGNEGYSPAGQYETPLMPLLIAKLRNYYPQGHEVAVYEAATQPGCAPVINRVPIEALAQVALNAASTLYIPPAYAATEDQWAVSQAAMMGHQGQYQ